MQFNEKWKKPIHSVKLNFAVEIRCIWWHVNWHTLTHCQTSSSGDDSISHDTLIHVNRMHNYCGIAKYCIRPKVRNFIIIKVSVVSEFGKGNPCINVVSQGVITCVHMFASGQIL